MMAMPLPLRQRRRVIAATLARVEGSEAIDIAALMIALPLCGRRVAAFNAE